MTNSISEFNGTMRTAHKMVWELRNEIQSVWPTPDVQDSLRFAVTEAAEAMDAFLTSKKQYVRNNPDNKHANMRDEAADCAMMLLTALGKDYFFDEIVDPDMFPASLDLLCFYVAQANIRRHEAIINALATINAICNGSLLFYLDKRLSRIRNKHIGATLPAE